MEKKKVQVKAGDRVMVISGKDKGKTGSVKKVLTSSHKIIVEGINMMTKAQRPNPMLGIQGGLNKMEAPLEASNVMIVCPSCEKPTRIKHSVEGKDKVRVCKKCGEKLDI